jgi:hypothetical protein
MEKQMREWFEALFFSVIFVLIFYAGFYLAL